MIKLKKKYFLLPDKNYIDEFDELINKDVVILQYPGGKPGVSSGKIKKIDNYEFTHLACTEVGSSGSPIFLENNTKVIGIHKSGKKEIEKDKSENYGDFIGPIFNYFKNFSEDDYNNEYKSENNNEIKKENSGKDKISNNKINQMTIIYDIKKDEKDIQLFGSEFVSNNKNNCYLLIDGKKYDLCYELKLEENQKEKNELTVKLID